MVKQASLALCSLLVMVSTGWAGTLPLTITFDSSSAKAEARSDQPCTGRYDGEAGNIGLVDVTDRPYPHMVEAQRETHARLHDVHLGQLKPFAERAAVN